MSFFSSSGSIPLLVRNVNPRCLGRGSTECYGAPESRLVCLSPGLDAVPRDRSEFSPNQPRRRQVAPSVNPFTVARTTRVLFSARPELRPFTSHSAPNDFSVFLGPYSYGLFQLTFFDCLALRYARSASPIFPGDFGLYTNSPKNCWGFVRRNCTHLLTN